MSGWVATSFVALLGTHSTLVLTAGVVFLIAMLTEVTSNTAVTTLTLFIVFVIAGQLFGVLGE